MADEQPAKNLLLQVGLCRPVKVAASWTERKQPEGSWGLVEAENPWRPQELWTRAALVLMKKTHGPGKEG